MRRITFRLIVASLTFILGVTAAAIWFASRRPTVRVSPPPSPVSSPEVIRPLPRPIDPSWVYINRDIKWEAPPKYIEQTFKASLNSTIVVFYPTGDFASIGCTLYRDNKTKHMSISAGDDFSVMKGTWRLNDGGTIATTSRLTHAGFRIVSGKIPEREERWKIVKQSSDQLAEVLNRLGEIYVPIKDIGGFNQLSPMIGDDNQN
jgi:hypothetical protein